MVKSSNGMLELSPDAAAIGQCLSPVEYRTRKELAELAFDAVNNQAVHRAKIALLELIENHRIFRQYTNEEHGAIPLGWSFRFSLEGYRKFCAEERLRPTRAELS